MLSQHAFEISVRQTRRRFLAAGATAPLWLSGLPDLFAEERIAMESPDQANLERIVTKIVYDNHPSGPGLISEWGFGCVIQGTEKTILFDTGGAGWALLSNMHQLKLDPKKIDAVVLSHIHWDHTGGLPSFIHERGRVPVYIPAGFPKAFKEHAKSLGGELIECDESVTVGQDVRTTGTLGKGAIEEHALCVKTDKGWVVITGCAHPGVDNMAAQAKEVVSGPIHMVMGGFHMMRQSNEEVDTVIDRLEGLGVQRSAPCHCSGDTTRTRFKERLEGRCSLVGVGDEFRFRRPGATA
ncbi:MAG: MBL fold metallo-hydrolase [Planctomycetes bacterium]|nr:MBL fold metallo-hydrolase [Planctomycetota bacterium]